MTPHSHARTVSVVRFLKAAGGVRKTPGRIPRQQQPDAIRLEYYNAIHRIAVAPAQSAYRGIHSEILQLLIQERRQQGKMDVARTKQALDLIDKAAAHVSNQLHPRSLLEVAEKFGKRTDDFNRQQLDRQIRSAIGVPLSSVERPIRDLVPLFVKSNVELIKTIPDRYHDRIAKDVQDAFENGTHPQTLAERFVDLEDISESDARRIARDQIGKLNGQFNQERQQAMGVNRATWSTMHDNRVRDEHAALDGRTFDWSDGIDGLLPGMEIQCRCYGSPDFSELLDSL